ncbi:MAG TPA: UPF0149 family protein [Candidatus Acidoferrum sp.]
MRTFTQSEPLTDTELDRLGDFLKSCKGGKAMNVEALDGFFAALIAGPETVMPSEYYSEVFGGEMSDACEFGTNLALSTTVRETKIRRSTFPPPHHPLSRRDAVYFPSGVYSSEVSRGHVLQDLLLQRQLRD